MTAAAAIAIAMIATAQDNTRRHFPSLMRMSLFTESHSYSEVDRHKA